jgi:hypothetical protein
VTDADISDAIKGMEKKVGRVKQEETVVSHTVMLQCVDTFLDYVGQWGF